MGDRFQERAIQEKKVVLFLASLSPFYTLQKFFGIAWLASAKFCSVNDFDVVLSQNFPRAPTVTDKVVRARRELVCVRELRYNL